MYCAAGTKISHKKNKQQIHLYPTTIKLVTLIIKNLRAVLLQYYLKIYTETFYLFKNITLSGFPLTGYTLHASSVYCVYLKNLPKFIFEYKYLRHCV